MDQSLSDPVNANESEGSINRNSWDLVDQGIGETVITITSDEDGAQVNRGKKPDLRNKGTGENSNNSVAILITSEEEDDETRGRAEIGADARAQKAFEDGMKAKEMKDEKKSAVIDFVEDMKVLGATREGEKVCRICHLSSEHSSETRDAALKEANLIQLGCGCKDELGIAHSHCAEIWFKIKGNRMCEICGETATNITGIRDQRIMDEWSARRQEYSGMNPSGRSGGGGCWRGQPFCNFLMACLVIAFVLPWFFRVNLF